MGAGAGRALRAALAAAAARGEALALVGAPSAYCARLAERAGFRGVYLSGGGVALSSLGVPDLGVTALSDVLEDARRITRACSVPLLVDADTGFGPTALNIARCVRDLEAGVAGLHLEDQALAKRCGHRPNKRVVAAEAKWRHASGRPQRRAATQTSSSWPELTPWPRKGWPALWSGARLMWRQEQMPSSRRQ